MPQQLRVEGPLRYLNIMGYIYMLWHVSWRELVGFEAAIVAPVSRPKRFVFVYFLCFCGCCWCKRLHLWSGPGGSYFSLTAMGCIFWAHIILTAWTFFCYLCSVALSQDQGLLQDLGLETLPDVAKVIF